MVDDRVPAPEVPPGDSAPSAGSDSSDGATLLGAWRLVRKLGAGGMGTVWLAERADGAFRKDVAVKVINPEVVSPSQVRRFHRERQILADLEHPNICRLLDGGAAADGRPYLVMERVDGQPLDRYFEQRGATVAEIVQVFITLCDALRFAHARGVIHRDLKPSNVMVTTGGEPKVLDFGIARLRESAEPALTLTGEMALTPSYASPEQWQGEEVGPASDVFSLGVMLYEVLVGSLPPMPGLRGIDAKPLQDAGIDETLRAIVLEAAHEEPKQRYRTVSDLAEALRRFLDRASRPTAEGAPPLRVFISCRGDVTDDFELATRFYEALAEAGASVFLAPNASPSPADWVGSTKRALESSNMLLLLLSPEASVSELIARELEYARQLRDARHGELQIITVTLRFPEPTPRHPLSDDLHDLEHASWKSHADTHRIVERMTGGRATASPPVSGDAEPRVSATAPTLPEPNERPGGVVDHTSPLFVAVPELEHKCHEEILKSGALIRIKGARQTGKTSFLHRVLSDARLAGLRTAEVNLQLADRSIMGDLDRLMRWLCASVGRRLTVPTRDIDEHWDDVFGPKDNCTAYFEEKFLSSNTRLVLAIDQTDRLFEFPDVAEELLSLLRAWNEMGKTRQSWRRMSMVLVYSTEMYIPMNINRSPFNVGMPVVLEQWNPGTIRDVIARHGLQIEDADFDRLVTLIGGHPHLVRIACDHLARGLSVEELLAHAATDGGVFGDHLKALLWHLECHPELRDAARTVLEQWRSEQSTVERGEPSERPRISTEHAFKLISLGLVTMAGNIARPARKLYCDYLFHQLGQV